MGRGEWEGREDGMGWGRSRRGGGGGWDGKG